ncbi:MAG: glycosyltransferase, partial [Rhodospirillaceae bacterium]|nr:glycosyltransferase [Rhodospirillaceae bacterium]
VGGDAVLACDPTDVEAMAAAMERIASDGALRARLQAAGRARLPAYTWEHSADALMAALERAAAPKLEIGLGAPLVSIVTPSFNHARFLRRTIDSVLAQTYPHIDYVVMDGGSTDGSRDILESYGDSLRWRSERDKGQTDAINKGFAQCRGQIRAYLNSDDMLLPDAVARAVDHFERHPACDMVYGKAHYIDAEDRRTGDYNTAPYSFARLMEDCCVCQPAAFWTAAIAEAVGPFDDTLDFAMDYDYWLRIARAGGHIAHMDAFLANSRLHADAKTLTRRSDIYREIFAVCRRHGGYVSRTYYEGLWHHRLWERRNPVYRLLRRFPDAHRRLAKIHRRWHGEPGDASSPPADGVPVAGFAAGVRRHSPSANAAGLRPRDGAHVSGFWPDGWLAGHATFTAPRLRQNSDLFVAGYATKDCELSMSAGGKSLEAVPLRRHQMARLSVPAPDTLPLELRFSAAAQDSQGREIAFKLLATNLFLERDV